MQQKSEDLAKKRTDAPVVIALVGPTGSGKSTLGLQVAQALQTEIISVDSMAVYQGMDIGTAKPSAAEQALVPHHLLDVVTPDQPFTAADFARLAGAHIARLHEAGKPTVLVGGTGLYLRALLHGLSEGPETDFALREKLKQEALLTGNPHALHERLQRVDPVLAERLHPNDEVRLLRALEVFELTGVPLSHWQDAHRFAPSPYRFLMLAMSHPREVLYDRINARVLQMVVAGLEEEVAGLIQQYGTQVKPMQGLGYLHFGLILDGKLSRDEGIALLQRDTRRFARRQGTWFRGEASCEWITPDAAQVMDRIHRFLDAL